MISKRKTGRHSAAAPFWLLWLGWLIAGCAAPTAGPTATLSPAAGPAATPGFTPAAGSALSCRDPFGGEEISFSPAEWSGTDFCRHSVEFSELISGGQPRDGIPPIEAPIYETIDFASAWVEDSWPILVVAGSTEVLAFPLPILVWHEVVNAQIDGSPIAVTYSPMSASGRAYQAQDLGTTGVLRFGNSVVYDRATGSWWQQLSGEAIVGEAAGARLAPLPSQILAWPDFAAGYPEGRVLTRSTGAVREYGYSPYSGLETSGNLPALVQAFVSGEVDGRLGPMARVAALLVDGAAVAYPFEMLSAVHAINDEVGGEAVAVFWGAGARSAVDAARVSESRDVGSAAAFGRAVAGQTLTFEWAEGGIRDQETGSTWSLTGRALAGPLQGEQLTRLASVEAFWFAWSGIYPGTEVWEP